MNNFMYQTKRFMKRNGSTILTCIGSVGVIATSVIAVKATPKALRLIEEAKEEKGEELTKMEVVKTAGPVYVPAVAMGVGTIACIFGANVLNQRSQAALMSAYAFLDKSYSEYKEKVEELYGDDVEINVRKEIAKDHLLESGFEKKHEDKKLFYCEYHGMFESTEADVLAVEMEVNRLLSVRGYVSLAEFHSLLGLPKVVRPYALGWSIDTILNYTSDEWIDFVHDPVVLDDGLECIMITTPVMPLPDFMDEWGC